MAHSSLHFALGMAIANACLLPGLIRAWRSGARLAWRLRNWLLLSYGLGLCAVVPNLLRRAGLQEAFCRGGWMNVFLLHPLLDRIYAGGRILGAGSLIVLFVLQYAVLVAAVLRVARGNPRA